MDEINTTQQCPLKYVCTSFAHVKETTGFITQIIQKVKEIGSPKQAAMLAAMVETSVSVLEAAKNASPETPDRFAQPEGTVPMEEVPHDFFKRVIAGLQAAKIATGTVLLT